MIIGVEPNAFRAETAKKMGANIVLDSGDDVVSKILDLTDGFGVDIAVEAIGKEVTLGHAFGTARIGGAITSLGVYGLDLQNLSIPVQARSKVPFTFYHRRFVTTLCPSGRNRLHRLMNLMQYGNLDLAPLWTHTLPLKNILEGYEMAQDPKSKSIKVGVRVFG